MVRPVESIRKDLQGLEGATATLAEEFSQIYATYLTVLGQAMGRQVVMATYHLCTQVYPEDFLALPVSDRGRLQQGMQTLGRKAQGWLEELMEADAPLAEPNLDQADLNRLEAALVALAQPSADSEGSEDSADSEGQEEQAQQAEHSGKPDSGASEGAIAPASDIDPSAEAADAMPPLAADESSADEKAPALDPKQLMQSVLMAAISSDIEDRFSDRPFTGDPLTPTVVAKHHLILEQRIRDVLQRVSRKANRLLRKAQVIPDLPETVLEAAADADMAVPKGRSVPNVLNVLVAVAGEVPTEFDRQEAESEADVPEEEDEEEALEGTMTHLAAIQLRLADLEFGDVQTALWRSKLRTAVGRLRKLGKQYQRAERELAIAQAEQAWRAVWYDGSSR